jgi:ADP-ribose pyrophosphatase YjhB (NUDIX family)
VRKRVLAYVTRVRDGRKELLVFDHRDHPEAGTQVPAGRLDEDESLEDGLRRELHEEAGLARIEVIRELDVRGSWLAQSKYENHAFEIRAVDDVPDLYEHVVLGDGDDAGLVFLYRWEPLHRELELWNRRDPVLEQLC